MKYRIIVKGYSEAQKMLNQWASQGYEVTIISTEFLPGNKVGMVLSRKES